MIRKLFAAIRRLLGLEELHAQVLKLRRENLELYRNQEKLKKSLHREARRFDQIERSRSERRHPRRHH